MRLILVGVGILLFVAAQMVARDGINPPLLHLAYQPFMVLVVVQVFAGAACLGLAWVLRPRPTLTSTFRAHAIDAEPPAVDGPASIAAPHAAA